MLEGVGEHRGRFSRQDFLLYRGAYERECAADLGDAMKILIARHAQRVRKLRIWRTRSVGRNGLPLVSPAHEEPAASTGRKSGGCSREKTSACSIQDGL
jgi:hypothetical protein